MAQALSEARKAVKKPISEASTMRQMAFPRDVPALPSFKLHKFVSDRVIDRDLEYRTGVVYTTNRRLWEHDPE